MSPFCAASRAADIPLLCFYFRLDALSPRLLLPLQKLASADHYDHFLCAANCRGLFASLAQGLALERRAALSHLIAVAVLIDTVRCLSAPKTLLIPVNCARAKVIGFIAAWWASQGFVAVTQKAEILLWNALDDDGFGSLIGQLICLSVFLCHGGAFSK
jgi:hypothetical protein